MGKLEYAKFHHFKTAYTKVVNAFDFEYENDMIISPEDFIERTKDLQFSKEEKLTLNSKGKLRDIYQIIKLIMKKMGTDVSIISKVVRDKKEVTRERSYNFSKNNDVYSIINNLIYY